MIDQVEVASAVIIPDLEQSESVSSTGAVKRRRSSASQGDGDSKQPRLSPSSNADAKHRDQSADTPLQSPVEQHSPKDAKTRRSVGHAPSKEEERKRGRRLFGSILGTLSQGGSSRTERKRSDIEKKQQEKLKFQAEEFDEQQQKRKDELLAVRWKEQKKVDEQSMRIRHSNTLAMAHFLKTEAKPELYYRPFTLREGDQEQIDRQVEQAQAQIDAELDEFHKRRSEADHTPEPENNGRPEPDDAKESDEQKAPPDTANGISDSTAASTRPEPSEAAPQAEDRVSEEPVEDNEELEDGREHGDENEELVVAGEDSVIY